MQIRRRPGPPQDVQRVAHGGRDNFGFITVVPVNGLVCRTRSMPMWPMASRRADERADVSRADLGGEQRLYWRELHRHVGLDAFLVNCLTAFSPSRVLTTLMTAFLWIFANSRPSVENFLGGQADSFEADRSVHDGANFAVNIGRLAGRFWRRALGWWSRRQRCPMNRLP